MAHHHLPPGQRGIERLAAFAVRRPPASRACAAASAASSSVFTSLNRLPAAGLSGRRHRAQSLLHRFEPAAFCAQKFYPRRFHRLRIGRALECRLSIRGKLVQFGYKILKRHKRSIS